ncbi:uncharacterized protein LOC130936023 isoform X1 [Arachis stenosperma]|uniref:uncharacterized protein LOC130936023 isoform X1 n=2 Tax=Arachis stenosperma TaxID=217475 RepID=UPI0025AC8F7F|nr:uncharacterized protein LOC130936023 isoform X1 [Arachis stenosperma]XP_057721972.1 uncharacterized protein LOC130936023 isoform X1 [Arachis stenosperma]XP_057721973.1 uncharacterized protein LOC130936023 isoform X1 [Arachis stenosperma]
MQDSVYPSCSYSANHGDAGNSFVALLYGPPSLLQYDFKELSDQKLCTPSGSCTAASGNFVVDCSDSGTFPTSSGGIFIENLNSHNLQSRQDTVLDSSSRAMVGLRDSVHSVFHDIQSNNTAAQSTVPGGKKAREPFSSWSQWCSTNPASSLNVCGTDNQTMPNMVPEQCSSNINSLLMSGCPRVFCMEKSGYLLLSNTGLLGIVCLCHSCHMSVLKFCEHAGLYGINPGDAVHMENGETIAQWKNLYLLKFGIRSLGNESEWDWPEVLSTTGSLMRSNSSSSSMSKSDLSQILSSSAVRLRSAKPCDYVPFPKATSTDPSLLSGVFPREQPNTIQESGKIPLKGFVGTCTTTNIVGIQGDDGCQPVPPFLDSLKRNDNFSVAHSPSQIPTSFPIDHACIKNNNEKDVLTSKDAASSNIELRLGQPPQTGNPVPSFIGHPLFNALVSPPNLHLAKPMINMHSSEGKLQNNFCHGYGSFKMVDQPQPKIKNYMPGVSNAFGGAARSKPDSAANSLLFSPLPQLNLQPEGKTKASEILMNDSGPDISKKHYEFNGMQFSPINVPWKNNGHTGRQLDCSAVGSIEGLDNDKGVDFAKDSCAKLNSGFGISNLVKYPSSIRGAVGGNGSCVSTVKGKIYESYNESRLPFDTSGGVNFLCDSKNVSSVGQKNHFTSGTTIPLEGILKGFPFLVPNSTSNQTTTSPQQQGINLARPLLDENMRLLAVTQILELSKQRHALHFHKMNQKHKRASNTSEVQPDVYEALTSEQFSFGATFKLPQKRGLCGSPDTIDDLEKLASLTGLNRYCFSGLTPLPLHSKEKKSQCKQAYNLQNEGQSLSLGINNDNTLFQRSSASNNFTEKPVDTNLGRYTFAAGQNRSSTNFFLGNGSTYNFKQFAKSSGETPLKIISKDESTHQWRGVPSKLWKADCDAKSLGPIAAEGQDDVQSVNTSAKRFKRNFNMEDLLKVQEKSNVSTGSCAPMVTQASMEFNKIDSCIIDGGDATDSNNHVLDEGSVINKGWSPDAVESERSSEFLGSTCESYLNKGHLRVINDQDKPCRSLLDELKLLDSMTRKKSQDQSHILSGHFKANQSQNVKDLKGKKKRRNRMKNLDASLPSPFLLHNKNDERQMYFPSTQRKSSANAKHKHTSLSPKFPGKHFLSARHSDKEDSYVSESSSDDEFHSLHDVPRRKKQRADFPSDCVGHFQMQDPDLEETEIGKVESMFTRGTNANRITRPIVCGEYGEICSEQLAGELPKIPKFVSLSKVLKSAKRCKVPRLTSKKKLKRLSFGSNEHCCGQPGLERGNASLVIFKGKRESKAIHGNSIVNIAPLKLKNKEIRKVRSINELTAKETKVKDIVVEYGEDKEHGWCNTKSRNFVQECMGISIQNSDAFCSVCQNSSNDDINCLLECSRCLIRVHQACYGISTLPKKGRWCCRPCRTNSKDIACVLCGYGGGAMTRATQNRTMVKSLLKAWSIEKGGMSKHSTTPELFEKETDVFDSTKSELKFDQTCGLKSGNVEISRSDQLKVEMSTNQMQNVPCNILKVHNSITAGVHDTSVKQWIHMVCGLWTPGTRCPNVNTMSAFDVSGVTLPREDVACSICNRWGGSCIECRIVNCLVKFHPWCAHQKNLLQCETEGDDDENVGFYGRCMLHAVDPRYQSKYDPVDDIDSLEEREFTCARTEGYKGCKRDGFHRYCYSALKGKGGSGCLVPEEQLNAWIHINGQKSCPLRLPKPASDIEHDCRKEYARYKLAKGWKHLVVYKSGIHALGLYTSRFISRGEMVVEYVGEIVGSRVADKREIEYQSERKLQYKGACYFFRIDKEHIIDATKKGGIARFVNHSCLPNCVAKVVTIRHEKKVVFFAERDIYPGEEITYDYHFNNEDEGKKIPCYCNSKNCRRYLN